MIVTQQLVQEVNSLVGDKALVVGIDEAVPGLPLKAAQNIVILRIQFNLVLVKVIKELIRAKHLGNLDQLVRIRVAVEEGLLSKNHGGEHGAQTPHVEAIIVLLEIYQQLRTFKVSRCNTNVVLCSRVVEFGQTPVNQAQLDASISTKPRRED